MVQKWYEVTCDYCGRCLNHYIGKKPTKNELINDGFSCTSTKVFCDEACFAYWNHDKQERQFFNINPSGKIHAN